MSHKQFDRVIRTSAAVRHCAVTVLVLAGALASVAHLLLP
jgi:hypothetical protein